MKRIFKYELETTDNQEIEVHRLEGYTFKERVLKIDVQKGIPCIWILVDDEEVKDKWVIKILGTGHDCFEDLERYLGSYQLIDGNFTGHVFY